ncbi:7-cyano-7-deazaguanine synthase [Paraburkholderia sp. EG304]|uniref:7-cyano-7-deazaguanine synthase n=1 Tax=Paraburkholderia sp. EG304 TaxID=3237015 RepID=UPI0039781D56
MASAQRATNSDTPGCRNEQRAARYLAALERRCGRASVRRSRVSATFRIETPLMHMTKANSIDLALALPGAYDALAYSHTCYAGKFPPCGECHACVPRAHGFDEAGVEDPLIARAQA